MRKPLLAVAFVLSPLAVVGCGPSHTASGAGIGAGVGAIAGAIIGHQSGEAGGGALVGAGVGGLVGGGIGAASDHNNRQARERAAYEAGYHDGRYYAPTPPRRTYYEPAKRPAVPAPRAPEADGPIDDPYAPYRRGSY